MNRLRIWLVTLFLSLLMMLLAACDPQVQATSQEGQSMPAATQMSTGVTPSVPANPAIAATETGSPLVFTQIPASKDTPYVLPATPTTKPATPVNTPTLAPRAWRTAPVIPISVSQHMLEIYQLGQSLGNNPHAFSIVGDCQSMLPDFLGDFDNGRYNLGEYTYLQPVVDYFTGSFGRKSRGVKDGLTASGVLATLWNTWKDCNVNETPLECEYRINQPSYALISFGTNDANGVIPFEDTLRRVIDVTLEHGIVPILATKADNAEGNWSINATILQLAYEYQIPVWNFWLAVQPLPLRGLRSPEHLTYGEYTLPADFSTSDNMQYAYNVRNLTAMQVLDVVWRAMTGLPASTFVPTPISYLP
jgi:hypothetical protein